MPQENFLISWTFPEFTLPERSRTWYMGAILIALVLLFYAIVTSNFLFGLIVILTAVVLVTRQAKEVEEVFFGLNEDGVQVGEKFFEFKEIKIFWIIYEPPQVKNLYFETDSLWRPRLTIPLQDANPVKVRRLLLDHMVKEDLKKENEPLSEALGRRLKL